MRGLRGRGARTLERRPLARLIWAVEAERRDDSAADLLGPVRDPLRVPRLDFVQFLSLLIVERLDFLLALRVSGDGHPGDLRAQVIANRPAFHCTELERILAEDDRSSNSVVWDGPPRVR